LIPREKGKRRRAKKQSNKSVWCQYLIGEWEMNLSTLSTNDAWILSS
jgi:hypothetical protein